MPTKQETVSSFIGSTSNSSGIQRYLHVSSHIISSWTHKNNHQKMISPWHVSHKNTWRSRNQLTLDKSRRINTYKSWADPCFSTPSLSLLMTVPRVVELLLMCVRSFNRAPSAPVLATRSDPARFTRFNPGNNNSSVSMMKISWYKVWSFLVLKTKRNS